LKRCSVLLAAQAILLLNQGQAKAILNVRIFDDGPNLKVTVDGSITGSAGTFLFNDYCGANGFLSGQFDGTMPSLICSGHDRTSGYYSITGPAGYGGTGYLNGADSVDGYSFIFIPSSFNTASIYKSTYQLDDTYVLGAPFFSSATFNGKSLASEGFTTTGLIGTWTIDGSAESINVCIGTGPCSSVSSTPGPLPLLGAGAAFGWSRRLRKRIAAPGMTPPKV